MKKKQTFDLDEIFNHMINWAMECGDILNTHLVSSYRRPLKIVDKGKQGLATQADLLSEAYVIKKIKKHYPGHLIVAEEDSFAKKIKLSQVDSSGPLWLIDPLDGTNNFFNKVPFFAVSLAFGLGKDTLIGVVYNPVNCELFYAIKGQGAYVRRLIGQKQVQIRLKHTGKKKKFKEALLSANLSGKRVEKDLLKSFPEVRAMRRFGSAALELSYVAAGMLDAYWEYNLKPWDVAAAGLICEEAGVEISSLEGGAFNPFCSSILAADPTLYESLKAILRG